VSALCLNPRPAAKAQGKEKKKTYCARGDSVGKKEKRRNPQGAFLSGIMRVRERREGKKSTGTFPKEEKKKGEKKLLAANRPTYRS